MLGRYSFILISIQFSLIFNQKSVTPKLKP